MAPRRLSESEKQDLVGRYKTESPPLPWLKPLAAAQNRDAHGEGDVLPQRPMPLSRPVARRPVRLPTPTVAPAAEEESSVDAVQDEDNDEVVQHWPWTMPTTSVKTPMR